MKGIKAAVLTCLLAAGIAVSASAAPRATLSDLEDEVMCMTCGTALSLSESPGAERQRALIQRLVDRGLSKDQIKVRLVEEFGPNVLAAPPRRGFSLAAYLVPAAVLLLAGASVLLTLRRRRGANATPDDLPVQDEFEARVDADLAGFRR